MRQASKRVPESAEKTVRDIRRATRRHHSVGAFFILCTSAGTEPRGKCGVSQLVICASCRTGQMISPGPPCASQPGGSGRLSRSAPCLICECPHGGPRASFVACEGTSGAA